MQYPKYKCSIRSVTAVELEYPKYHDDDDEDDDDDDEDVVEEDDVQLKKYVFLSIVSRGVIISVPSDVSKV